MKKSVLLAAAVWMASLTLTAQSLIQRVYPSSTHEWRVDMIWSPSDETYAMVAMNPLDQVKVSKTDRTGILLWQKTYSIAGLVNCNGASLDVGPNGMMYVCGTFYEDMYSCVSHYILCLDKHGVVLWTKTYRTPSIIMYECSKIKVLDNGDLLLTESVFGHVGYIRTDAMGNLLASHIYREDSTAENKSPGFDSDVFPDGSFIFTGKRHSDIMVIRTSATGEIMWHGCWNSGAEYYHAKAVVALDDGSSIIAGHGANIPFLMRIGSTGNKLWYYSFEDKPGGDFFDLKQLDPNTFIAVGNAMYGGVMVKFDINGNISETRDVIHPLYFLQTTNVVIGPGGAIAWPLTYCDNPMISFGTVLMIANNAGSSGCMFESSYLAPGLLADPNPVPVPVYMLDQNIVVSSVTTAMSDLSGDEEEVCSYFHLIPFTNEKNDLVIASTVIGTMDPVKFSMTNYAGGVIYTLSDMTGRIVVSSSKYYYPGDQVEIDTGRDLSCGMYTLNVEAGKEYFSEKFIVQ